MRDPIQRRGTAQYEDGELCPKVRRNVGMAAVATEPIAFIVNSSGTPRNSLNRKILGNPSNV